MTSSPGAWPQVVLTAGFMLWGIGNPHFLTQPASLAALTALQVVQRVANSLSDVAIERDWVVVLSQRDPGLLAEGNAQIRRIDQVGEITSTLIFGAACTAVGTPASLVGTVAVALALTPVQLGAIFALRRLCGPALARQWVAGGQGEKRGPLTLAGALAGAMRGVEAAKVRGGKRVRQRSERWTRGRGRDSIL